MSFTDGKQWTINQEDLDGRWGCKNRGEGLRCGLCGELPALGSRWRWVYANAYSKLNPGAGAPGGNFFVCSSCDPEHDNKPALAKRRELYEQLNKLHRCFSWSEHCPRPEDYR